MLVFLFFFLCFGLFLVLPLLLSISLLSIMPGSVSCFLASPSVTGYLLAILYSLSF